MVPYLENHVAVSSNANAYRNYDRGTVPMVNNSPTTLCLTCRRPEACKTPVQKGEAYLPEIKMVLLLLSHSPNLRPGTKAFSKPLFNRSFSLLKKKKKILVESFFSSIITVSEF